MLFEIVLMIIPKSILSLDMYNHTILLDSHVHRVLKHLKRVHFTHSALLVH